MKRYEMVVFVLCCLGFSGCSSNLGEPPLSMGNPGAGELAREAKLSTISEGMAIYDVNYPAQNLKSEVYINLSSNRLMTKEVFEGQWVVEYNYTTPTSRATKMPDAIIIYTAKDDGDKGDKLNEYRIDSFVSGKGGRYKDSSGKEKTVEFIYFDGISGG